MIGVHHYRFTFSKGERTIGTIETSLRDILILWLSAQNAILQTFMSQKSVINADTI
jgi:hypothetical protein